MRTVIIAIEIEDRIQDPQTVVDGLVAECEKADGVKAIRAVLENVVTSVDYQKMSVKGRSVV